MPKYPSDKRRYYDPEMSDPGRAMSRGFSRGRGSQQDRDREHRDAGRSSSHQGRSSGGYPQSRPGEPSTSHGGAPYPSSSTSQREHYSSSARGESIRASFPGASARGESIKASHQEHHRPSQEHSSETMSETASVTGSTGGGEGSSSVGRGSTRGRRVLPPDIITRPRELKSKQGGYGQPISLQANYFKLLSTTDWCLYQYAVEFAPEEDRNVVRKGLLRPHREVLGAYIFDGTNLYTSNRLPEPLQLTSERLGDNSTMIINIKLVGDITRGDHQYIQFFNIIMRKCLDYLQLQLVGRNYFDALNKAVVRDYRLELWPGYITSIRQHERDILLCAEITHKVMRDETLLDVLSDCYKENSRDYQNLYLKQVMGIVVLTDYNNNTYRIDDVDFTVTPNSTFKKKNGDEITYAEYYRGKYNINVRNMNQPLLVSRSKPRDRRAGKAELVYLVPELCRSTGLTDGMRANFKLMSALAQHTRVSPSDRIKKLLNFNKRLHSVPNVVTELKSWNLTLDRNLVNIPARVFPCDRIVFGNQENAVVPYNANWTGDLRNKEFVKCGTLNDWILLVPNRCKRDIQNFVSSLIRVAANMRFVIEQPRIIDLRDDNASTYADTLEQVKSRYNPMLIFCVATNNRVDRYAAIKKKCCVDRPVPTQVILAKNLSNPKSMMSIATKVAIQMNCKIGGIPWTISIPLSGLMVVGFDVCHDTNSKEKDFGAMVASIDTNFGRYFSAVSSHTNGEELSNDLSVNLCKALNQFKYYNNALPKKIVIYRDGVGDGQINYVFNHEVQNVKTKLENVYTDPNDVKLAYIIVTKKINTRLFYDGKNPPPGTVVDDIITDPSKYDFLIVSQHVGQGTVSPTAYNVIWDTSGLDVDKIQRLTYKLCHMYFNWSGTVRVPAPCQYAHKLAFLVAQAVHQSPDTLLETLLYFL